MRIPILLLVLAAALACAGCLDYTQEIAINPDGSGSTTVDFGISAQLLAMENGENGEGRAATRNKFIALRDRLKANPAVSEAGYREYREGDLQHFVVRITLADITRLGELQDELAGGAGSEPTDSGGRSKLTLQRRADGSTSFRYLLAVSQSAMPTGSAPGDEQMTAATREMLKSAFAGRYFTIRLRGPQVRPEPAAMVYGTAAADGSSFTWRIPFAELFGGDNFARELAASVAPAGRLQSAGRPAHRPEQPPRAVYTGNVIPTMPEYFVGNYQLRLPGY